MKDLDADFSGVPTENIEEFVAQGEKWLDGTVKLGIAADSKAATYASAFSAIAVALAAGAATLLVSERGSDFKGLITAGAISATVMFGSVLCFAWAALPVDFQVPGHEPTLLAKSTADRTWMLRYLAGSLQRRIHDNRAALERTARWTKRGLALALAAIPIGLLVLAVF